MKILKRLVLVVLILIAIIVIAGIVANESLPTGGKSGEEADKMALKMEKALGKEHWHDIQYVQWTFVGMHHFLWDKHRNMVRVKWGQNTVYITPGKSKGAAFIETERVSKELEGVLIKSAIDFFNNDMFWLIAPYKTFDDGVSREVVDYEGDKRLLVTYSSGGSTPGDSYLWKLEADGTPESYKMWVQIIPIGGLELSWERYYTLGNGVRVSHFHEGVGPLDLVISDVKVGYGYEEMNCEKDPFKILIEESE